ncbi:ABC transporter permease [Caenimonas terrae]|uniref:ABC transporter permease n=1 Tax=Caenimonas terrae TaxID=696074 RepID=A0ABW0NL83_9BURK
MNLHRVLTVAAKEVRHLLRDPRSLALMFLLPAMMLFIYGYGIRLDLRQAPIGLLQEAQDADSRELAAHLAASPAFRVLRFQDRRQLRDAVGARAVWAALVIPDDYSLQLQQGRAQVQLVLDGMDANTARLLRNEVLQLVTDLALARGRPPGMVTVEMRTWFNETSESRYAIVPGVIVMVMGVVGTLMTALTIAREMESGNVALLRTTPLALGEFLAGKLLPYFVVGMLDVAGSVLVALVVFDVPLRGSLAELAGVSALFLLVVMAQGALISLNAGNQVLAAQMVQVTTFLPAFLLSGAIYAIANMPEAVQAVTLVVPARYFVTLSKAIFLKGTTQGVLWINVAALSAQLALLTLGFLRRGRVLGLR